MQGFLRFSLAAVLAMFLCAAPQPNTPRQPVLIEPLLREAQQLIQREEFEEAYRKARLALNLSQRRGYKVREARATHLLALAAISTGRVTEAITLFKRAAAVAGETEPEELRRIQMTALERAGRLLRITGRYEDALWCFHQVLQITRQRRDRFGEVTVLGGLSAVYSDTGDFTKAAQYVEDALPLAQTLGNRQLEQTLLLRSLIVEKGRGNFTAALQFGQQALAILPRRAQNPTNKIQTAAQLELLYNLGTVYAALEQPQKATELYEQAFQLTHEMHVPQFQGIILGELAGLQLKSGHAATAVESATRAMAAFRQGGGNKPFEATALFTLAEAQAALDRKTEALSNYRQAIATLEQARSLSIPTEVSRAGIVATRHNVFAGAIDFLLRQQQTAEALEVAEAYHARAFLDVLAESGIESTTELSAAQKEEEDQHFARISSIQRELWKADLKPEEEAPLKRQLEDAEAALEAFRLKLRRANPRYASVEAPPLLKPDRIAEELLDADTALLEFVLGEKKSYLWLIQRKTLVSVALPPRKEIEALVTNYRTCFAGKINSLTAQQAIARQKTQGQQLYQKLLQPLEAHLSVVRKLIIVPDGALAYLPFETLVSESKTTTSYLLERFAISYAPSASALAALKANQQPTNAEAKGIIAFGDPLYGQAAQADVQAVRGFDLRQLPYTRLEVNGIAALFPAAERRIFLGAAAHEQTVKTEPLTPYRYVHFAAHGTVDEEHPARSGIVLSLGTDSKEDGMLQMSEVLRLKLNAELVTLSACRTGLGKLLHGEGIIGLTRAFFYAGADSVVVSLWNVNDMATASLMKAFYQNLQRGKAKAEALREAKRELLKGQQRAWRHPYYWAAFILVGGR
jgi:CHAT domain-containing protein